MSRVKEIFVAAIDFGTTYSGYAYSFKDEYNTDPLKVTIIALLLCGLFSRPYYSMILFGSGWGKPVELSLPSKVFVRLSYSIACIALSMSRLYICLGCV